MTVLPFFLAYIGPGLLALGAVLGGAWTFLPVAFIFGLLPILDDRLGRNDANPTGASGERRWIVDLPLVPLFSWLSPSRVLRLSLQP